MHVLRYTGGRITNFGDELNTILVPLLTDTSRYSLTFGEAGRPCAEPKKIRLACIGSITHLLPPGTHVFGSGIRTQDARPQGPLVYHAIRGELSARITGALKVPRGDPALLLPLVYKPEVLDEFKGKVVYIPHQTHYRTVFEKVMPPNVVVVSPHDPPTYILSAIVSSDGVISSSLHGLIVADAYGVPNVWLKELPEEGAWKFHDYFSTTGRGTEFISTLGAFTRASLRTHPRLSEKTLRAMAATFPLATGQPTIQLDPEDPGEFYYLGERVLRAPFVRNPFKHIYITDFFHADHLAAIENDVHVSEAKDDASLVESLVDRGYKDQSFPGAVPVQTYLDARTKNGICKATDGMCTSLGAVFRLLHYRNPTMVRLMAYLNGTHWESCCRKKFGITADAKLFSAVQKYLDGYEISPHPDVRSKALTYLVNTNVHPDAERDDLNTHLCKCVPERDMTHVWAAREDCERSWIPWDWTETVRTTHENNALVMFAPGNDTLHAVKLNYDHLQWQHTNVYGNMFFIGGPSRHKLTSMELWRASGGTV